MLKKISVSRQLLSLSDPKLFFIDPTLHFIAHLYILKCFGEKPIEEVFGQDVLVFPFEKNTLEFPIFSGFDRKKPASAHSMNRQFKKYAIEAGFPANITSYAMRHGFVRDMFASGTPTETIKKLLHHTPSSIDAVSKM